MYMCTHENTATTISNSYINYELPLNLCKNAVLQLSLIRYDMQIFNTRSKATK